MRYLDMLVLLAGAMLFGQDTARFYLVAPTT